MLAKLSERWNPDPDSIVSLSLQLHLISSNILIVK